MNEEEVRQKIRQAFVSGNIVARDEEAFGNMDLENPDFTITKIELTTFRDGFNINYSMKSAGFGSIFVCVEDGKIKCDNECMGKNFLKTVFNKLVDEMELEDE